ncbi:MAG: sigma factor-like helix-turn-helix DNA-binding protein [Planctomycetota bacterium]|nr:sigma factor-like helix-turn-helix DNA-binding protein [Planctomycetota bacterium]
MLDGFSYREIAATMGISSSQVGVKLNRIKQRLAEQFRRKQGNAI